MEFQINKIFYAKAYLARCGYETMYRQVDGDHRLYYVNAKEDPNANATVADVVLLGNSTGKPRTTSILSVTGNDTSDTVNAKGIL